MNRTPQLALFDPGRIGMERAVEHAERERPGWSECALAALSRFARIQDDEFTIEKAREAVRAVVPDPPDGRAWGAVTQLAIRRGFIVKTGHFASAVSSNGSPKRTYRKGPA